MIFVSVKTDKYEVGVGAWGSFFSASAANFGILSGYRSLFIAEADSEFFGDIFLVLTTYIQNPEKE